MGSQFNDLMTAETERFWSKFPVTALAALFCIRCRTWIYLFAHEPHIVMQ